MKQPYVNEIRHLLPRLRRKMLAGEVAYRDQTDAPRVEDEHDRKLMAAGQRLGFGGQRDLPEEHRIDVLARDNLGRMPHISVTRDHAEG